MHHFEDPVHGPATTAQGDRLTVGISGPSGSGKTWLVAELHRRLESAAVLQQDWFFIDPEFCPPDANFCDPRYLKVDEFVFAVSSLCAGKPVDVPLVDFSTFRQVGTQTVHPAPLTLIEGMTIFRFPEVLSRCQLAYYLAPPMRVLAQRKRARDVDERSKSAWVVEQQLTWLRDEYELDLADLPQTVRVIRVDPSSENLLPLVPITMDLTTRGVPLNAP